RRLAARSRPPTPEGRLPGFPRSDVATPIRPITGRPSLAPSSFTRRPVGLPRGSLAFGEGRGVTHVPRRKPGGAVRASGRWRAICGRGTLKPLHLATYRFGSSLAAASGSDTKGPPLACRTSRPLQHFTWVDPTTPS